MDAPKYNKTPTKNGVTFRMRLMPSFHLGYVIIMIVDNEMALMMLDMTINVHVKILHFESLNADFLNV